jgi:hypothetical protein
VSGPEFLVVVTAERHRDSEEWGIDVIDREGLPLDGTAPWDWNAGSDGAPPLELLAERAASFEPRIVATLSDLQRG